MGICGEEEVMLGKSRVISLVFSGERLQVRGVLRPMNSLPTEEQLSYSGVSTPVSLSKQFKDVL